MWENNKTHNDAAHWIQDQAKENKHVPTQEWSDVTTEETIEANRTSNWKAAGCDDVANFWFKQLTRTVLRVADRGCDFPDTKVRRHREL